MRSGIVLLAAAVAAGVCEAKSQVGMGVLYTTDYQYGGRQTATDWTEVTRPGTDPEAFSFKYRVLRGFNAMDVEVMVPDRVATSNDLVSVSVNGQFAIACTPYGAVPREGLGKCCGATPDIFTPAGGHGKPGMPWLVRYKLWITYAAAGFRDPTPNLSKPVSCKLKVTVRDQDGTAADELSDEREVTLPAYRPLPLDAPYAGAASRVKPDHVVFLGADGLGGWHMDRMKLPFIKARMAEGAWSRESRTVLISGSGMNWGSIFTCAPVEYHGHWTNDMMPVIEPYAKDERGLFPSLFSAMRAQMPKERTMFFFGWDALRMSVDTRDCTFGGWLGYNKGIYNVDGVPPKTKELKPRFAAVVHGQPDYAGHGKGHGTKEYIAMCERVAGDLAKVYQGFLDAGITPENSVFVFTADHGGLGMDHGGYFPQEMNRPLVIWGKGVKRNYRIEYPGNSCDTGATLAALLGLTPLRCWTGKPIDEAFER